MEQLVARQAHNLEVVRSSRASATTKGLKQNCFKPFLLYNPFKAPYQYTKTKFLSNLLKSHPHYLEHTNLYYLCAHQDHIQFS